MLDSDGLFKWRIYVNPFREKCKCCRILKSIKIDEKFGTRCLKAKLKKTYDNLLFGKYKTH